MNQAQNAVEKARALLDILVHWQPLMYCIVKYRLVHTDWMGLHVRWHDMQAVLKPF